MQQDTFYPNFSQDPRFQYQNAGSFQPQINSSPWTGNFMSQMNLSQPQHMTNAFNFGNQLQTNITPTSTTAYGSTTSFSWAHTVPSLMPWVTQGDQQIPDPVMRFTAPFPPDPCTSQTATSWELLNNLGANKSNANIHLKRKSDLDILDRSTPHKICITEEKMAARLKELHISNQYSVPAESSFGLYNNSSNNVMAEKSVTNLQQLEAMLKNSGSESAAKSLILAPEIKQLVEPEKIFSSTFLDKVERPSMAVVLWQPQSSLLTNVNNSLNESNKNDDEKKPENSNLLTNEIENNNYLTHLPPLTSAIKDQNMFTMGTSLEASSSSNAEDVMDT